MRLNAPIGLVLNARSGSRDAGRDRETLLRLLSDAGREHTVFDVGTPQQLSTVALEAATRMRERQGILAVAGGDGTINAAAQVALGMDVPLGIIPRGTFNYFSRAYRIPLEPEAAVANLLEGEAHPVQAGLVNGRIFLVNASIGLYPRLLQDREIYKRQYGRNRLVALWSALVTLLREHRQLTLRYALNGRDGLMRTPTLFVGNNALQLEQIGIPESREVDAGQLAAIVMKPRGRLAMLRLLLHGALGDVGESHDISRFAFRELTVDPRLPHLGRDIRVATDGEVAVLAAPLKFEVSPHPLRVILPRRAGASP